MASDNIVGVTEVKLDLKPITVEYLQIKKSCLRADIPLSIKKELYSQC